MLNYIVTFFLLAVLSALLGFGGLAVEFAAVARFLSAIFVILFIAGLVYHVITGRKSDLPL